MRVFGVHWHLPETGSEIQSCENVRFGPANVTNALTNFFHGVFVNVRVLIEFMKILHNSQTRTIFLGTQKISELYMDED